MPPKSKNAKAPEFTAKKFTLEEFMKREKDHKIISTIYYEMEDTGVAVHIVRLDQFVGSEFMKFDFENPVYIPIEKIYFTLGQNLMAIAPPFLYVHDPQNDKGHLSISKKYDVTCDLCPADNVIITENDDDNSASVSEQDDESDPQRKPCSPSNAINYITTSITKFYCEECWEKADDENLILVMAGELRGEYPK